MLPNLYKKKSNQKQIVDGFIVISHCKEIFFYLNIILLAPFSLTRKD